MDKNTIIGLILIAGILVGFFLFNKPSADEIEAMRAAEVADSTARVQDSLARIEEQIDTNLTEANDTSLLVTNDTTELKPTRIDATNVATPSGDKMDSTAYKLAIALNPDLDPVSDSLSLWEIYDSIYKADFLVRKERENEERIKSKFGVFAPAGQNKEKSYYFIENRRVKLKLSSIGGQIVEAHVKNYISYEDYKDSSSTAKSIQLFDEDSTSQNLLISPTGTKDFLNTIDLNFTVAEQTESSIKLRALTNDPDRYLEFHYHLDDSSYVANYDINLVGLDEELDANKMDFRWNMKGLSTEKLASQERTICGIMYKCKGDSRDYLNERGADKEDEFGTDLEWIAFKHNYFSSILFSENPFNKNNAKLEVIDQEGSTKYTTQYKADISIAQPLGSNTTIPLKMYFGPNDYHELEALNMEAESIINLGPSIFRVVNQYFIIPIFDVLKSTGLGYGLIIILMTLIIKIVILPLTYKNYKSSAKMRILKPEIQKINEKYPNKDDAMKKQQETMALYKKSGASPMAGCIPMLIQMPILFAAFRFFPSSMDLRQESFLWADDLSAYDAIVSWDAYIPYLSDWYGNHISLFTVLMCVSTIFYTRLNSSQMSQGQPGMPNMKVIMYIFPIFMLFIFNSFAAGLSLYYLCGNLMNMGLMWAVKKYFIDEDKLKAKMAEKSKKPAKQSKFQARLAEMAKQQQVKQQGRR